MLKGRPVYIGLAVDLSDYEINIDPSSIKPLNLEVARNPKDVHQAALEAVIEAARKAKNIVVIVDAYDIELPLFRYSSFLLDVHFVMKQWTAC